MRHYVHDGLVFEVVDRRPAPDDGADEVDTADGNEAIVLLHGFPQGAEAWDAVATRLTAAGYRTLAPNQRGCSPGARPSQGSYRFQDLVTDVRALLVAGGVTRAHVVGHDWGGLVAWALAGLGPAGVAPAELASVTVVSTPHPSAFKRALLRGQGLRSWYMALFQVRGVAEWALRPDGALWGLALRGVPGPAAQAYTRRMREPGALSGGLAWYRGLPRELLAPSVPITPSVVPTRYVWGARDPALGRAAAEATGRYVKAPYRFVVLPQAGHWIPERHPDELAINILEHVRGCDQTTQTVETAETDQAAQEPASRSD